MNAEAPFLVILLAVFQVGDAVACAIPVGLIERNLDRLGCPQRVRRLLPRIKLAAAAGLAVGLFVPIIGLLTCVALVAYFSIALAYHLKVDDPPLEYVPALTVTGVVIAVAMISFLPAL